MVKPYKRFQSQGQGMRTQPELLIACLIVEIIQRWFLSPLQATVTLHKDLGYRNGHEHNALLKVYRHA